MRLVTTRLILRRPTLKDAEDIAEHANNLNVSKYLALVPYPYNIKDSRKFISSRSKKEKHQRDFAIMYKPSGKVVGMIGFMGIDNFSKKAEVGYWLGEKYWGQGIATEAMDAMVNFAFQKLKLIRLQAEVCIENRPSANLLKKFGFKKEGLKRKARRAKSTGKWHDVCIYGLLKSDIKL